MKILTLVVEKAGAAGLTPMQIYDQMSVGVQSNVIAKVIKVLYESGFLNRSVALTVDTRLYNYRATRRGHEVYLEHSFDEVPIRKEAQYLLKEESTSREMTIIEEMCPYFDPCIGCWNCPKFDNDFGKLWSCPFETFGVELIQETTKILKFRNSPNAGMPDCICSLCRKVISEDETPKRLFGLNANNNWEMRFHYDCYKEFNSIDSRGGYKLIWSNEKK